MAPSHRPPFFDHSSPCANLGLQLRRAEQHIGYPATPPPVLVSVTDLANCTECDMCGGCETHEGCLTDLNHLDWFTRFASPGETPCAEQHVRHGYTFTCALPAGHGQTWHQARTGDGWGVAS